MGQVRVQCSYCGRDVDKIEMNPTGTAMEIVEQLVEMMKMATIKCKCGMAKKLAKEEVMKGNTTNN